MVQTDAARLVVWLVEHGFKDSKTLTTDDFVTIAKANIKALAEQKD